MHVRISFGISNDFYSGLPQKIFQGTIQGNGALTAIWILVSIFLLRYVQDHHPTPPLFTPITLIPLFILATMCIDYSDLFVINSGTESIDDITNRNKKKSRHLAVCT